MASSSSSSSTTSTVGKWLFFTHNDFLQNYADPSNHNDARKLRTLKLQTFIFHHDRLLLLQDIPSQKWTAPYTLLPYSLSGQQTIWKIILRMLRQTIEENQLVGLQFPDLSTSQNYILEMWKVEDGDNWGMLQLNVVLTVEREAVDERRSRVECEVQGGRLRWFGREEVEGLRLFEVSVRRVGRMFEQMKKYIFCQNNLILAIQAGADTAHTFIHVRNLITNAAHIRLGIQTIYRGHVVPFAIVLVKKDMEKSPLFIMEVTQEIHERITMIHRDISGRQEVSVRVPLPDWQYKTTMYVVVGKTINGDFHFKPEVDMAVLKGVLRGWSRLGIEWLHWNREVKLIERVEEVGVVVVVGKVRKDSARDSLFGGMI